METEHYDPVREHAEGVAELLSFVVEAKAIATELDARGWADLATRLRCVADEQARRLTTMGRTR
jgi:hypothetical protein